jgi:hypothetical protein
MRISFYSTDRDNDLLGYQIFLSSHSRGWDYNHFYGENEVRPFWANPGGWNSSMYMNLFKLPPSDLGIVTLSSIENELRIPVTSGKTYFITVMPLDAYGKSIGRKVYPESNELKLVVR